MSVQIEADAIGVYASYTSSRNRVQISKECLYLTCGQVEPRSHQTVATIIIERISGSIKGVPNYRQKISWPAAGPLLGGCLILFAS